MTIEEELAKFLYGDPANKAEYLDFNYKNVKEQYIALARRILQRLEPHIVERERKAWKAAEQNVRVFFDVESPRVTAFKSFDNWKKSQEQGK